MFRINKEKNIVESLEEVTFSELGYRERENLQGFEPGLGRIYLIGGIILSQSCKIMRIQKIQV